MTKNDLLILITFICILIILLCGCDNRKCIKSHNESGIRPQVVIINGSPITMIVPFEEEICDEYEIEGSDSNER